MRVDVVGAPTVTGPDGVVTGSQLGGRRAHILLAALALEAGATTSSGLAELIWSGRPPDTWPVALRGVVRSLRTALTATGAGDQDVVVTVPGGYRLAGEVEVDVVAAADTLRAAEELIRSGRYAAAGSRVEPLTRLRGSDLLSDEDAEWLAPHRAHVDDLARQAWRLAVSAAGLAGDQLRAVTAARDWVAAAPMDEPAHRALIEALDAAGDRAGALHAFESCRTLLADELGVDPTHETVAAYLHALGEPSSVPRSSVPRVATSFRGRSTECADLSTQLEGPGLVSLVGRGGVGKSRLATEVLRGSTGHPGGCRWVPLESVVEDALVLPTVALAQGVVLGAADSAEAVVAALAPLGRTVLVLDGAETALDGVAWVADELTRRCPQLTVLVTSREPLGLEGERVVSLAPWSLPDQDEATVDHPAIALLLDRVRDGGGDLPGDQATGPLVRSLLQRCSGLPLAVELVAAQLAATSPGDLADQLDELLVSAEDPVRALARSSYASLSTEEAAVFRRFAVLDGTVPLSMVRAVVSDDQVHRVRVLRVLGSLAGCGLMRADRATERWRWTQDDELHRFARDLLAERDEGPATYARLAVAVRALLPNDSRSPPGGFAEAVTDVLPSVRSLFAAGTSGRADPAACLELAFRLHRYWAATNVGEGKLWLGRLLEATEGLGADAVPYATYALGYLEYWSGDTDRAISRLRSAADLLTGLDDTYVARALVFLAGLLDDTDRPREAIATLREALAIVTEFEPAAQMPAVMGLGSLLSERGDPEAVEHAVRAIELCQAPGTTEQLTIALPTAAMICWQVGAVEQAQAYVDEAIPLHREPRISRVQLYSAAAGLALGRGDLAAARELAGTADREGTELGVDRELPLVRCILARARLEADDVDGAAEAATSALEGGLALAHGHPLAVGLETAALVLAAQGVGTEEERHRLLATAVEIRARGDRPAPAGLRLAVEPSGEVEEPRAAARLAVKLLTP